MKNIRYSPPSKEEIKDIIRIFQRNIGDSLRKARNVDGLSIDDLVEKTKISKGTISNIENGNVDTHLSKIAVLCHALNVNCVFYSNKMQISDIFKAIAKCRQNLPKGMGVPNHNDDDEELIEQNYHTHNNMFFYGNPKTSPHTKKISHSDTNTQDDEYFNSYINLSENFKKKQLIIQIYELINSNDMEPSTELEMLARATCRYIIFDTDETIRKKLEKYYKHCSKQ